MTLYLADLKDLTETEIKAHISEEYSNGAADRLKITNDLKRFTLLVAYESVGDYGCNSTSWFLLREKATGALFEFTGGHCSCYGFEGQYRPDETGIEYLQSSKFYFGPGGYDRNSRVNEGQIEGYLAGLSEPEAGAKQ